MHAMTVGVDLAKNHFELAVADEQFRVARRERLTRARFSQFFGNHPPSLIVMEACGSAHY
jgi:transposase